MKYIEFYAKLQSWRSHIFQNEMLKTEIHWSSWVAIQNTSMKLWTWMKLWRVINYPWDNEILSWCSEEFVF